MQLYNPERLRAPKEVVESASSEAMRMLRTIADNPENKIHFGGAATVYRLPGNLCMKLFEKRSITAAPGNPISVEAGYLELLTGFTVKGVRVPHYFGHITAEHEGEENAIIMEELHALDLERVIKKNAELPNGFSVKTFFDNIEWYIDALHQRGIVHGDIELRNIMIDKGGNGYVIDFGRAKRVSGLAERESRKLEDVDWETLKKARAKFDAWEQGTMAKVA